MKNASVLLFIFFLLLFVSCSDENVYRDPVEDTTKNIWRVQNHYFATMQEAADYIIAHQWASTTKALGDDEIPEANTAHLLKNVLAQKTIDDKEMDEDGNLYSTADVYSEDYRKGLAITDKTTTGKMKIDFGGYRYDFYYESSDKDSYFFKIDSGEKICIVNGQSVIFNEADHNPYAISVNTKVVTIDAHLLDDRRRDPSDSSKSDSNLIYVGENGHLSIEDVQPTDNQNPFEGRIAVVTDGTTGATLDIATSTVTVDNIYTMYRNEDGTVSETIASGTVIPEEAKSHINIGSGDVTILAINQQTDYYDSSTGAVFDKAVINVLGTKEDTTITTPHSIQETIDEAVEHSDGDAKHNIIHTMTYYPEVPATCTAKGHKQYWICTDPASTVCAGRYYLDADGTTWTTNYDELILPIDPTAHNLEHVKYKAATCTENGSIEYWHCTLCGKYFSDASATTEITEANTVIKAQGHKWETTWSADNTYHWHQCSVCGAHEKDILHSSEGYTYDLDAHWHVCKVCEAVYGKEAHEWSDYKEVSSGHLVATCSICGAKKVAEHEEYLVYDIGIGEARLKNIEATPCGDFLINGIRIENNESLEVMESTVTAEFIPYLNSNTDYTPYCYVNHNGSMASITTGTKDTDGNYKVSFTLSDKKEYGVNIQAKNQGGTLGITCYLHLKNK